MKRNVLLVATALVGVCVAFALTGCFSKDKPKNGLLKPGSMLYINVRTNQSARAMKTTNAVDEQGEKLLTPKEIVEQCQNFCLNTPDGGVNVLNGISDKMKDFENERIKMWGGQIVNEDGTLVEYFIKSKNVRICTGKYPDKDNFRNIIAYIPNKVMEEGYVKIKKAYDAGNMEEVYRLFQEVFTAIPITPSEYAKLREKGEN